MPQDPKNLQITICQPCSFQPTTLSIHPGEEEARGLLPKCVQDSSDFGLLKLFLHGRCPPIGWGCLFLVGCASLLPSSTLGNKQVGLLKLGSVDFLGMEKCVLADILCWTPSQSNIGNHLFSRAFVCFSQHQLHAIGETLCHRIALNIVSQIVLLGHVPYRLF